MKIVVLAYHNIGCTGIKALVDHGFDIQAVFTHQDDPHENQWFESVTAIAAENDLPVFAPDNINHPLWVERIRQLAPEAIFSFYYRSIIGKEILAIPSRGCLNLHGSLLPRYRGRCPVNWVLVNGEKETGVTLHYMDEKPDNGEIVDQERIAIADTDTAITLHHSLNAAAGRLLDRTLPLLLANQATSFPQDPTQASYFGGRRPEDGEIDWEQRADQVCNLVRAVTRPYPGAFSYIGNRQCLFWATSPTEGRDDQAAGIVLSTHPLVINCGQGAVTVQSGQMADGLFMSGNQLATDLNLTAGMRFGIKTAKTREQKRKKHVLILGADGFIGNHLSERLLESGHYEVHAMDLGHTSIGRLMGHPDFHFSEGDISIHREWIEYHVRKCDIILPLVAIATPAEYVRNPLKVFELDFEENLRIVRYCAKYRKRVIFPSTSEVYGMCDEEEFDEERSRLVLGPINKQRWIYSCSKQLLDRVIWAYGATQGLQFTLIRPFNWIGSSRAITQLILNLVEGTPINLVDGGRQKRCFTDIKDGIECLFKIIENKDNCCDGRIFNIGNPDNEASIKELASLLTEQFERHPLRSHFPPLAGTHAIESQTFYGTGYEDVQHRRPSIKMAQKILNWQPRIPLEQSIEETLNYFLRQEIKTQL